MPGGGLRLFLIDADELRQGPLRLGARAVLAPGTPGWRPVLVGTGHSPGPVERNRLLARDVRGAVAPGGAGLIVPRP